MPNSKHDQGPAVGLREPVPEGRVPLTVATSSRDFRDFYWLKSELQSFCRSQGLSASGGKREIADRIDAFLSSGRRMMPKRTKAPADPAAKRVNQASAGPFTLRTRAPAGFKCTQEARKFFEANVSPRFRFTVTLQNHIKANPGISFAEIAEQWKRETEGRKTGAFKPAISPQFEFNRFTRDFHADPGNAGKTRADCLAAWKRIRAGRGEKVYRSPGAAQPKNPMR